MGSDKPQVLEGVELGTPSKSPVELDVGVRQAYPRVLILDSSRLGSISATGQVKKRLFAGWPNIALLQIHAVGRSGLGAYRGWGASSETVASVDATMAWDECRSFRPDVIYYRPHETPVAFHRWAEQVIERLGAPVVTHLMDDWIRRLGSNTEAERLLQLRLERSAACLSIGEAMSVAFGDRYGVAFQPVANCVEPDEWLSLDPDRKKRGPSDPVIMRYVGTFADDMTCASVVDVARAVDSLHRELGLALEVHTMERWLIPARRALTSLRGVSVRVANLSEEAHRRLLVESDVLLIAYNFDESSIGYVRYSMANKMPDYLASGVPVLAYGARGLATIDYLAMHGIAEVVADRDSIGLSKALRRLITDTEYAKDLGQRGREFAFKQHNCEQVRRGFHQVLCDAAGRHGWTAKTAPLSADDGGLLGTFERAERAHLDEVRWVGELLGGVTHGVMVDVGAHHGRALAGFLERGWQVYAFEPDGTNRARLEALCGRRAGLIVDARAVSDKVQSRVPFFASEESTGISTLSPFLDSHRPLGMVATTTIEQAVQQYGIQRIDLLKIDAEGYDLMVLKAVPWTVIHPLVVVCEFEDRKTVRLGYRLHEMAQYLLRQGYRVWLSEWHPVLRYGIQHDWRRLVAYPCHLNSADAWGNLVAFRHEIPDEVLREAASSVLEFFAPRAAAKTLPITVDKADASPVPADPIVKEPVNAGYGGPRQGKAQSTLAPSVRVSLYERIKPYLLLHHPLIARIARSALWNLRKMRQHPVAAAACGMLGAGSLLALLWMGEYKIIPLWITVTAVSGFFGAMALGKLAELEEQQKGLEASLSRLTNRTGALEAGVDELQGNLHDVVANLNAELRSMSSNGPGSPER